MAAVAAWVALRRLRSIAQIPLLFAKSGQLTLLGANGSVPDGEPSNARTAMVVGVLWSFDKLVAIGLRAVGLATIPSSLASLFLAYSGLSVVELTAGEATADKAVTLAKPGVEFLGRSVFHHSRHPNQLLPSSVCMTLLVCTQVDDSGLHCCCRPPSRQHVR